MRKNGIVYHKVKSLTLHGEFSLFHRVNNPGHWLENSEIWAAPGRQVSVASQNGYVRPPWKRISSENIYLSEVERDVNLQGKIDIWLEKAFPEAFDLAHKAMDAHAPWWA